MKFLPQFLALSAFFLVSIVEFGTQVLAQPQVQATSGLNFPAGTNQQMVLDGWIGLFDGTTTFGWTAANPQYWEVIPSTGQLQTQGSGQAKAELMRTTAQFDDFELNLEFKAGERTNSGVFIRTNPKPKSAARDCYEINITTSAVSDYSTGSLVNRAKTDVQVSADQWHRMKIKALGDTVQVWLDDQQTADFKDPSPLGLGYIGLQAKKGAVAFRNIRLKPLSQKPLFDGTLPSDADLSKWNTDQSMDSKFCLLYTSPSPRDRQKSRMPSSA